MELVNLLSPSMRSQSHIRRFSAGETIISEGEPGSNAFVLLSGECEVIVHGEVLNIIRSTELFGEIACLEGATRTATVRAASDSEVLELAGDALRAELRQSPALLENFLKAMAHRTRDISARETVVRDEQRQLRRVLERLQPSLDRFKDDPLLKIEVRWQPLTVVSGDYYDVLELAPRRFLCVLGDVMGHGAVTAPIIGMIRSQLHESAEPNSSPDQLLMHLHRHMRRHGHANIFMTLTLLIMDLDSRTADFACAGPPSPLLCRGGRSFPLTDQCGWALGYPFEDVTFDRERMNVAHGDVFLFYSDGLSDAVRGRDPDVDTQGAGTLADILTATCGARTKGFADAIFSSVAQLQTGRAFEDDATALVVVVH